MSMEQTAAAKRLIPIDPGNTTLGGEIGRRIDLTVHNNLLAINVEKDFLQPFRDQKGEPKQSHAQRYVGLGKLIDALISFSAYTKDPKVIELKDRVVDELLKTQLSDGYVGIFRAGHRISTYWDLHEMVYIIHALVIDYERFDNKASLEAARKLADYIMKNRKGTAPPRKVGKLNLERAFIALSRATGEKKYLDYAVDGMKLRDWDVPVGGHAYTFMNVCLAQLDLYDMTHDAKLLDQSRRVVDRLVARDSLIVSGSCSRREAFHDDQRLDGNLSETCATAYLIRLLHVMMSIEGNSMYGDMMERAIYNALFAAQLSDGRRLRYFTPLEGKRPVFQYDTYCCPNNFRRIVAELPSMVYYKSNGGLAINLYTPSSTTVSLDKNLKLTVRQETDYPNSGKVVIHLDPSRSAQFPLQLRIPAWCKDATLTVNGHAVDRPIKSGTFLVIDRVWKSGDRVQLDMPMPWRLVKGRKRQAGRVAVMRGPMLFCLNEQQFLASNPSLAKLVDQSLDGKDKAKTQKNRQARLSKVIGGLRLDPQSLGDPVKDKTVRPDGLACAARGWSQGTPTTKPTDLVLPLSEFADPGGTATYFLVPNVSVAVDDELIRQGN